MQQLENLEITKVAFVPQGDNKKADILLFKSKPADNGPEHENGKDEEEKPAAKPEGDGTKEENEKCTTEKDTDKTKKQKGADNNMKISVNIDKSKLTPDEIAQCDAIIAKAAIQEEPTAKPTEEPVGKAEPAEKPEEDIYKGLHPAVAARLEALQKKADEAEEREMLEVAKKYELLGDKPEELAKTLKGLKNAGGTAYNDMIRVLDMSLKTVEKSGAFTEIGKSTSGQPDAWTMIEKHADEIMKASPTMTRVQAIDKACEQHPDLVAEYEQRR